MPLITGFPETGIGFAETAAQTAVQEKFSKGSALHLDQQYFVYMLASGLGGTLYVGVTNDLLGRV